MSWKDNVWVPDEVFHRVSRNPELPEYLPKGAHYWLDVPREYALRTLQGYEIQTLLFYPSEPGEACVVPIEALRDGGTLILPEVISCEIYAQGEGHWWYARLYHERSDLAWHPTGFFGMERWSGYFQEASLRNLTGPESVYRRGVKFYLDL